MKLFPPQTIKEIELDSCRVQNVDSIELMERAADAVACEIISRFLPTQRIVVIAGPGGNGGDALATARLLVERGYKRVEIFLFNVNDNLSHDCGEQRSRLLAMDDIDFTEITKEFMPPALGKSDVVVDGLFGAGLSRPLQGGFMSLVRYINESGAYVISIDIPSGLQAEWNERTNRRDVVHAKLTLPITIPHISFFFEENAHCIGEWKLIDIDLDHSKIRNTPSKFFFVESNNVSRVLKPRAPFSVKRDFGSLMIMAGSMGMMGAAMMAAKAAIKTGAGLVTVHSARCGLIPMQTALCEVMFEPDKNDRFITDMRLHHSHMAVAAGPGIGTYDETIIALEGLLKNSHDTPLVLDADALNCISKKPAMLSMIPKMSVITPHRGEFDRLFGVHEDDESRLRRAIEASQLYNIIIVLKGHHTAIVRPDGKVYFNSTGNPGMATAGSGDVLTGVIASFVAQGYKTEVAATIGVYIHGLAGDMAASETGEYGLTASDIINYLPLAIKELMK